jgi:hypothetical protein
MPGDVLYGRDSCIGLYTINLTTAAKTVIGFGSYIGFPGGPPGQSHIPTMKSDDGILYGILSDHDGGSGTYYLVSINTTNGDVTYISTLPAGMQNIAFYTAPYTITPVPTINLWGMIIFMVLAGIGAAYHFRRQRRVEN